MIWATLGATALGFALAHGVVRRHPGRFPNVVLTLVTGPAAGLIGALLGYAVLGTGHPAALLTSGAAVTAVLLSLLVRTPSRPGHTARAPGLSR